MFSVKKDFQDWMRLKDITHNSGRRPPGYKERDIWWTRVGSNIGFEEDGKGLNYYRPVLIIKGFSKQLIWGIPLSTTKNRGKYYYDFYYKGVVSVVLLSQMRAFDTLRLVRKYGSINQLDFENIKHRLKAIID